MPIFSEKNHLQYISLFYKIHNILHPTESKGGYGVGATIINGDSARWSIDKSRAWEGHIRHVSGKFVDFARMNEVFA